MPIRNPFARRSGTTINDENVQPVEAPGFERVDTVGSKSTSVLSISTTRSHDTEEYKMSVVDSGVYLPPSPTEEQGQWPRRYLSRTSTDTRSSSGDIEHFSISRESFDSYRRSFDISARAPVNYQDNKTRASLDSHRFPRLHRSALDYQGRMDYPTPTAEEPFEDVGLDDQKHHQQQGSAQQSRKRGFFSKFSDGQEKESVSRFLIPGRKRGQSGQGAELGSMDHPKLMVTGSDGQEIH